MKQKRRCLLKFLICSSLLLSLLSLCLLSLTPGYHESTPPPGEAYLLPFSKVYPDNLPTCLVIGVRKGGTRALLDMISLHSKVKAANSEVHFFDVNSNYAKGYDWYSDKLPRVNSGQVCIEKSPSYFVTPQAPKRILRMNETIKLLLIVRDPVTRLISDYTQILYNHYSRELPYKSFEELSIDVEGKVNRRYDAVARSLYVTYMKTWLQIFSREQIHIVNGDRLIQKPWQELRKVESFLNLNHEINKKHFYFNASKGFHCIRSRDSAQKCLAKSKGRQHPNVSKEVVQKLRKFFRPYNYEFYSLVNKDFGWPEE